MFRSTILAGPSRPLGIGVYTSRAQKSGSARPASRIIGVLLACLLFTNVSSAADRVDYLTQIKPLLTEKCYSCHGRLKQESDLRLETRSLMIDSDVIVPGKPVESELLHRVTAAGDERMPPEAKGRR